MFYVTSIENGKYGIMDTRDNVEEFYTKEVSKYLNSGVKIIKTGDVDKFIYFIWHFTMNSREFSASEFEDVIDIVKGVSRNSFKGSRHDYVESLKDDYNSIIRLGVDINIDTIFQSEDMMIRDLVVLYDVKDKLTSCEKFAKKWNLYKKDRLLRLYVN